MKRCSNSSVIQGTHSHHLHYPSIAVSTNESVCQHKGWTGDEEARKTPYAVGGDGKFRQSLWKTIWKETNLLTHAGEGDKWHTRGIPVRTGTWKLWETWSALGFWFSYKTYGCAKTAKSWHFLPAILRAVLAGRPFLQRTRELFTPGQRGSLLTACPKSAGSPNSEVLFCNPTHHMCGCHLDPHATLRALGFREPAHTCWHSGRCFDAVNNEGSHLWPRNLVSPTSIHETEAA